MPESTPLALTMSQVVVSSCTTILKMLNLLYQKIIYVVVIFYKSYIV
jgi:hypothetical protein